MLQRIEPHETDIPAHNRIRPGDNLETLEWKYMLRKEVYDVLYADREHRLRVVGEGRS